MQIKPDVLTVWPVAFDYPEWRYQILRDRKLFNKVILVFNHNSRERDFRPFLWDNLKETTQIDTERSLETDKWYDVAINAGLKASSSEWVLFLEQDFWFSPTFMDQLLERCDSYDFCCHLQGNRLHLACFAVKRHLIEQTMKYFYTINTPQYNFDCFDLFTTELQALTKNWKSLDELGFIKGKDYYHLTGLTQNYHQFIQGYVSDITNKEEFKAYNKRCMEYGIAQEPNWMNIMRKVEQEI